MSEIDFVKIYVHPHPEKALGPQALNR